MDKYEYKLKLEQLKNLVAAQDYRTAAEMADSINWKKVRNSNTLCMVGDIYERMGRYDACREVLLQAYDHSSIGRNIVSKLAQVAIKAKDPEEAEEYYQEFLEIAPKDNLRYILAYQISCLKNAPLSDRIAILEELKEREYSEQWAYELAALYGKAEMREKCVSACDELILWFGDGEYVEKALDLKRMYQPLTPAQEEKYQKLRKKKGMVEINIPQNKKESSSTDIPEVTVTASKFNTRNLQEELANSMRQIMNATEKETVSDTMDNIKKIVNDIPYLTNEQTETPVFDKEKINEKVDQTLKQDFKELLGEEQDGQMSLHVPEQKVSEPQVSGQMSIEDVLAEWEKTKRAAEAAIAAAEQKKLEMAKEHALKEAGEIMDRLKTLMPILSATPGEDLPEKADTVASHLVSGNAQEEEMEATKEMPDLSQKIEKIVRMEESEPEEAAMEEQPDEAVTEEQPDETATEEQPAETATEELPEEVAPEEDLEKILAQATQVMVENANVEVPVSGGINAESGEELPKIEIPEDLSVETEVAKMGKLSQEQRELFSYFLPVPGMEEQICQILMGAKERIGNSITSLTGNILIQGEEGSGKTVLATSLIKAIQKTVGKEDAKIGKISAESLNHRDFASLVPKIAGGYLIIDKAGDLEPETAARMSQVMEQNTQGMVVVLEDTKAGIKRAMNLDFGFAKKFTEKINIPIFTIDELVDFGKSYAEEMECTIDEMGVLALYNRINNIQKLDRATTLAEVKEIVDEAIENAESGGLKRAFGSIFTKKYNENDYLILREKDFES